MNFSTKHKLAHFFLNLDYPTATELTCAAEANMQISRIMNQMLKTYGTLFKTHTFIYEYSDDLYSLIGYRILRGLSEITDFHFVLYGKPKKTKKYVLKSQRVFSKQKFKKAKNQDNIVLFSHYNPIYKVLNLEYTSNDFKGCYSPIATLTPAEMFELQKFYEFEKVIDKDFYKDNAKVQAFQNWIGSPLIYFIPNVETYITEKIPNIDLVWVEEGDSEETVAKNIKVLQEVEQSDNIVFYFYNSESVPILNDINYQIAVKHYSNRPSKNYMNCNFYDVPIDLSRAGAEYRFIGDWPTNKKGDFIAKLGG